MEEHKIERENKHSVLGDPFIFAFIHDIKNMMVPIVSRIELLQVPGISDGERNKVLNLLNKDCEVLSNTMNAMVEICRCRSGLGRYSESNGNLSLLVLSAMDVIAEPTMAKGVTIINQIPSNLEVFTDQEALMGIFINLLANAVKFSYRGGRVVVSTIVKGEKVLCTVRDNGMGMEIEKVTGIIEDNKFYHSPGTEGELGNGFGLMLCEALLNRMGTCLSYGNNEGGGAWFSFELPLSKGTQGDRV